MVEIMAKERHIYKVKDSIEGVVSYVFGSGLNGSVNWTWALEETVNQNPEAGVPKMREGGGAPDDGHEEEVEEVEVPSHDLDVC